MGTQSLFSTCKGCGTTIKASTFKCPACGDKQKKLSIIHWVGITLFGLILVSILNAPENSTRASTGVHAQVASRNAGHQPTAFTQPAEEAQFIAAAAKYAREVRDARNELHKSILRDKRKAAIANALESRSISSWIGTISQLDTNTEGKAILAVKISPDITLKTWNNELSDVFANTLVSKSSPLYSDLLQLSMGQRIEFSGSFFPSKLDYVQEVSMTMEGSMREPEFLMKFSSVKALENRRKQWP